VKLAVAVSGIAPSVPETEMEALVAQAVLRKHVSTIATDTKSRENLVFMACLLSKVGI